MPGVRSFEGRLHGSGVIGRAGGKPACFYGSGLKMIRMSVWVRRGLAGLLAAMLLWAGAGLSGCRALGGEAGDSAAASAGEGGDSALTAGAEGSGEVSLTEDEENGFWEYRSPSLTVSIHRYEETVTYKKKNYRREYCVAEVFASPESPLLPIMTDATKKRVAGYKLVSPEILEEKYLPLFAMSDDMYGIRLQKYDYKGVVIRNGEIMATKTRNSAKRRAWPNLDTMALFADGSMKTYVCDAYTAEEYLAMGATQVFSFGPWLLSDGEINPEVLDPDYYPYNEPRVAMGMIEPWHYILIVVRGRPTSSHAGVHLDWLAEKMKELGCVEALNLDGGQTAIMMFNGKIIMSGQVKTVKKQLVPVLRSQGSMITFGTREERKEDQ